MSKPVKAALAVLCLLVAIAYWPAVKGPAILDDTAVLHLDPNVMTFFGTESLPAGTNPGAMLSRFMDRPVTVFTFAVLAKLFGGPDGSMPAQHILNILLHAAWPALFFLVRHH